MMINRKYSKSNLMQIFSKYLLNYDKQILWKKYYVNIIFTNITLHYCYETVTENSIQ